MMDNVGMWISLGVVVLLVLLVLAVAVVRHLYRAAKSESLDVTEVVSEDAFIGRVAMLTLGEARQGHPAQARLRDGWGQTHYVLVEPDEKESTFKQGDHVLLVRREGSVFRAIENPSEALVD